MEKTSGFKTILFRILLMAGVIGIFILIIITEVKNNATVDYYTRRYNTEENAETFKASPLGELAERLFQDWDFHEKEFRKTTGFIEAPPTTLQTPFLAVRVNGSGQWQVIGGSSKDFSCDGIRTLVVCFTYKNGASYRSELNKSGPTSSGSSEGANIVLLDVNSGYYQLSESKPKALPKKAKSTPHYTKSDKTLIKTAAHALVLPFRLSKDGRITGGKLSGKDYLFPNSVTSIEKLRIKNVSALSLPESITSIREGVIPTNITLTVVPGSYGENFARENGYMYRKAGGDGTLFRFLAGCECGIEEYGNNVRVFPDKADGEWVEKHLYFSNNTTLSDGFRHKANKIVMEPGSTAEAYALEHGCRYRYWEDPEDVVRVRRDGADWFMTKMYAVAPDTAVPDEELEEFLNKGVDALIVNENSPFKEACTESELPFWEGTPDSAVRTVQTEWGAFTVMYSFTEEKPLCVTVPAGYDKKFSYSGMVKDIRKDFSVDLNHSYDIPLLRVSEGSPAAEALPDILDMVYIIEDSGTLCVTRKYSRKSLPVTDELLAGVKNVRVYSQYNYPDLMKKLKMLGIPFSVTDH